MFEDLEGLMDKEITKDDLYKGLYFSTAMSSFYVEMIYDAPVTGDRRQQAPADRHFQEGQG